MHNALSLWGALVLLAAAPAWSCYSGLGAIPTADVVGAGMYSLEFQVDGPTAGPSADTFILNTEVGIGDRFECGLDYDFSADADPRAFFNAKYVVAANDDGSRALAAGIYEMAAKGKTVPYLVGTGDLGFARLHLGALRTEGNTRWFAGADRDLTDRINLCADYTSGDENYASVAANYQLNDHVALFGGALFPNSDGETLFTLHLIVCGAYRGAGGE